MKLVIGLVGENGSGKGTVIKLLSQSTKPYSLERITFSDFLKETLTLWRLSGSRDNFAKLVRAMRETYGENTLAHAIQIRAQKSSADIVLLDGVRWEADASLVRSFKKNLLIYVTADAHTRFERLRGRGEKSGEAAMTFEKFTTEEETPNEQGIPALGKTADIRIENNGTERNLEKEVITVWKNNILPLLS